MTASKVPSVDCGSDSCEDIVGEFSDHPSVGYISNFVRKKFNLQSVTGGDLYKILKSMKGNKATGCDSQHTHKVIYCSSTHVM